MQWISQRCYQVDSLLSRSRTIKTKENRNNSKFNKISKEKLYIRCLFHSDNNNVIWALGIPCVVIKVETRSQNFTVEFVVIKHFGRESLHVEPFCGLDVVEYMLKYNACFVDKFRQKLSLNVVFRWAHTAYQRYHP